MQLMMTSEDVIHDFSVPAFRIKHDVLPGRYETLWFRADRPGTYHLFCTQFCGTDHAAMVGESLCMTGARIPALAGAVTAPARRSSPQGQTLFMRYGCSGCHGGSGDGGTSGQHGARAARWTGVYGSPVPLSDGSVVTADDRYIRDSHPDAGDADRRGLSRRVMPSFAGQIGEEDLVKLIAYIKSLAPRSSRHERARRSLRAARRSMPSANYLTDGCTLRSWLLTTDHKRIALLYLGSHHVLLLHRRRGGGADALQPARRRTG